MTTAQGAPVGLRDRILGFERALNTSEVGALFGISINSVYKLARAGSIPSFRIGTSVRFDPKAVVEWLEKQ